MIINPIKMPYVSLDHLAIVLCMMANIDIKRFFINFPISLFINFL